MRLLAAILILSTTALAAPIPRWALGRWVAISTVEPAEFRGFGEHYLALIPEELSQTQLKILPNYLAASDSPYNLRFTWGLGVRAELSYVPLAKAFDGVEEPYVYGRKLTYDPDARVLMAALSIDTCAENGDYFEPQESVPLYKFATLRPHCTDYSLFQFPDKDHIAMWRKESWGTNRGLVIFERVPEPFSGDPTRP